MSRTSGQPKLITGSGVVVPQPIVFDDRTIDEAVVQQLIDEHPDLIPLHEIGTSWGPLISLGREIATTAGPIDNLLVSPTGELTVVEAKLWRNPESRRKVVGQILDYAAALKDLSYEELDATVGDAGSEQSIWNIVQQAADVKDDAEAAFVDTVNRNLRAGRFLLVIVGDGIKEDLEGLADLIGKHPDLGFHLELVEIRMYRLGSDMLLIPSLVGRTKEITRAIVEVRDDGRVKVSVEPTEEEQSTSTRSRPLRSLDAFVETAANEMGAASAEAAAAFVMAWEAAGGLTKLNSRSVNLSSPSRHTSGGGASLLTLYVDGIAVFSVAPLAEWRSVLTKEEAAALASRYGFDGGSALWPKRDLDLTEAQAPGEMLELLTHLRTRVGHEEDRLDREEPS